MKKIRNLILGTMLLTLAAALTSCSSELEDKVAEKVALVKSNAGAYTIKTLENHAYTRGALEYITFANVVKDDKDFTGFIAMYEKSEDPSSKKKAFTAEYEKPSLYKLTIEGEATPVEISIESVNKIVLYPFVGNRNIHDDYFSPDNADKIATFRDVNWTGAINGIEEKIEIYGTAIVVKKDGNNSISFQVPIISLELEEDKITVIDPVTIKNVSVSKQTVESTVYFKLSKAKYNETLKVKLPDSETQEDVDAAIRLEIGKATEDLTTAELKVTYDFKIGTTTVKVSAGFNAVSVM